jgi:hypothetical protein
MRTRTPAETLARGGRSRGRAAARVGDGTDRWGLPVSDHAERKGGARSVRAGRVGMGRPAAQLPVRPLRSVFFFFFCAVFA